MFSLRPLQEAKFIGTIVGFQEIPPAAAVCPWEATAELYTQFPVAGIRAVSNLALLLCARVMPCY